MKKLIALIISACMIFTVATAVSAGPRPRPNRPGSDYNTSYKDVKFYIQINGNQMDNEGNISPRPKTYFTDVVATSKLIKNQDSDFSLAIGDTVSEDDILSLLEGIPDDESVLKNVIKDFSPKGYIKSNTGEVISWSELTTENYETEWYVIKWESTDMFWHIDGRILDKETQEEIEIVVPEGDEPIPTPEPTPEPIPTEKPIDLEGAGYAYIFGYEPDRIERVTKVDEKGKEYGAWNVEIRMAPNDCVTREQVSAMLMRMIDQKYDTMSVKYPVTDNIRQHTGTWYERGLAYLASKDAFNGIESVNCGPITRGEVAKLVVHGLNLSKTTETTFEDIKSSPYKSYIEIMNAYGFMSGSSDTTFEPDKYMTRAEFCSMFNNIIGREDALLVGEDGTEVTPELYFFVDLDADAWYTPVMLRATSAYDEKGYVDIDTRLSNIRNVLDNYDSQKLF